jgi:RNA polymerase sigma factor (sigma-70 family)
MRNDEKYIELARKARLGDRECLNQLAEAARGPLYEYVLRLTLREDLTEDIVQESILEMYRVFDKLKRTERFWDWLRGIAFNKVRSHYGRRWRQKTASLSQAAGCATPDGLAEIVTIEFKQIVLTSMRELEPRHRAVLTMRCYDQMPYAEIARLMGCTQLGARALFYRAKKALAGKLSTHGLGKASLLAALILFGKMTATSEAAAASVSVTAATVKVGIGAALLALATSKTGIISLAAVGMIVAGSITASSGQGKPGTEPQEPDVKDALAAPIPADMDKMTEERWYFFPEGPGKSVMMRMLNADASGRRPHCQYLQNQHANYFHTKGAICIENRRMYNPDLSVRQLPTDDGNLADFISEVEGSPADMEHISSTGNGLLVICKRDSRQNSRIWRIDRHFTALEEEYFQVDWPESMRIIDNRDLMHKRGWTYFRISGQINGRQVAGTGRLPFAYLTSRSFGPWLKLHIANRLTITDTGREALVRDAAGRVIETYAPGSFFKGLARPWTGLHTIDTIRRDAAEKQIRFKTTLAPGNRKARIVLECGQTNLVYLIDLDNDLIEKITFVSNGCGDADVEGEVTFTYLQEIDATGGPFAAPRYSASTGRRTDSSGPLWLANLAADDPAGR